MNKHYKTLELHKIMDMLAEQAGNDETLRMISELEPVTDIDKVRTELKKTEDAFDLSVKYGTPPFYRFKDIRGSLQRAQSGSSLTLRELLDVGVMLRQIRGLTDYYASAGDAENTLTPLFTELSPNKWLEDKIQNAILSEDEIAAAILALLEVQKTVAEGAGATPVAACMSGKVDTTKKTVCVVSGGNVDVTTLSRVITRGLTYGGRLTTITTKLADRAGSLANLLNVVGGTGANVVRIHHEREDVNSEVNACVVSMVLETRNADHVQKIKDELTAKGYSLLDA